MKKIRVATMSIIASVVLCGFLGAQEKPTITWFVDGTWYKPVAKSEDSLMTKFMMEENGINVLASNPSEDKGEKLNLMIATGDALPDIITEPDAIRWSRLVKSGAMLDLTPHLGKLGNLKDMIPDQMLKMMRESNGKLYGLPQIFATKITRGSNALMYNQAYYAALGSPKLDNWESFEVALIKAKGLKTADGKAVIPLIYPYNELIGPNITLIQNLMASFGVRDIGLSGSGLIAYDEKNGPYSAISTDAFKKSLLLLNKWYSAGLIDRELFIQTFDQALAKIVSNQAAFSLHSYWGTDLFGTGVDGSKNNQMSKSVNAWWAMKPPVDKSFKGVYKNWDTAAAAAWHIGISAKSKNIDAALKWFNYNLSSRAQFIHWFGWDPEGKFTAMDKLIERIPNTTLIKTDTPASMAEKDRLGGQGQYDAHYGRFWNNPFLAQDIEAAGNSNGDRTALLDTMTKDWAWDGILVTNLDPAAGTPEVAIYQKIRTMANAGIAKIVMSSTRADSEKAYNDLVKNTNAAGIDKLVAVWKANYEANKAKMK